MSKDNVIRIDFLFDEHEANNVELAESIAAEYKHKSAVLAREYELRIQDLLRRCDYDN